MQMQPRHSQPGAVTTLHGGGKGGTTEGSSRQLPVCPRRLASVYQVGNRLISVSAVFKRPPLIAGWGCCTSAVYACSRGSECCAGVRAPAALRTYARAAAQPHGRLHVAGGACREQAYRLSVDRRSVPQAGGCVQRHMRAGCHGMLHGDSVTRQVFARGI